LLKNLLTEVGATGALAALALAAVPGHPVAVVAAIVLAWVGFVLSGAYAFMRALYHGDIVERRTVPRSYSIAPRAEVSPMARRFMVSYLHVAKSQRATKHPATEATR
jgi:hypothetical protein